MLYKGSKAIKFNDQSRDFAISSIMGFEANFGGTQILEPMTSVQNDSEMQIRGTSKRVFLLTDGAVSSRDQVIRYAR